jgi:hypothetical protein
MFSQIVNTNHQVAGFMGVLKEAPEWTLEEHRFHVAFPSSSDCNVKMLLMAATVLLVRVNYHRVTP